ncbi:MAG TPA: hypothetical protein VGM05_16915 [Planctomycetaceae bacterium]|jgi:hypothetical protein
MKLRIISLGLFLVAMPLTVIDSHGPGFFADSDGWQGYEVAFIWPYFVFILGAWWFIPIGFATAYILCGMWLTNAPTFVHRVGVGACCATFLLLPLAWAKYLELPFVLLEAAWICAAIARIDQRSSGSDKPPAPPPDAAPDSPPLTP